MFVLRNEVVVVKEHLGALRLKTRTQNTFNYSFETEVRISISDVLVSHGLTTVFIVDKRQQRLYLVTCKMEEPLDSIIVRELAVPRFNEQWLDACHTNHLVGVLNADSKITIFEWKFGKDRKPILSNVQAVSTGGLHAQGFVIPKNMKPTDVPISARLLACNECLYLIQTVQYQLLADEGVNCASTGLVEVHTVFLLEKILGEYTLVPKFSFSTRVPLTLVYSTAVDRSSLAGMSPYKASLRELPILIRFIFGNYIIDLDCCNYKYSKYLVKDLSTRIDNILFESSKRKGMPYFLSRNEVIFSDFTRYEIYKDLPIAELISGLSEVDIGASAIDVQSLLTNVEEPDISIFKERVRVPDLDPQFQVASDIGLSSDTATTRGIDSLANEVLPPITPLESTSSALRPSVMLERDPQESALPGDDSLGISVSTNVALVGTAPSITGSDLQVPTMQLSYHGSHVVNEHTLSGSISRLQTPQNDQQRSLTIHQLRQSTGTSSLHTSTHQPDANQGISYAINDISATLRTLLERQASLETVIMQEMSTYRHVYEYFDLRFSRLESMLEALCATEGLGIDPPSGIPAAFVPTDGLYDPADPAELPKIRRIQDSRELREIRELKELRICDSFIDGASRDRTSIVDEVKDIRDEIKRILGNALRQTQPKASILSDNIPAQAGAAPLPARNPMTSSMPPLPPRPKSAAISAQPPRAPASLKPSSSCGDLSASLPVSLSPRTAKNRPPRQLQVPNMASFNTSLDQFIKTFSFSGPIISSPSIPSLQKTSNYLSTLFSLLNSGCYTSLEKVPQSFVNNDTLHAFSTRPDNYKTLTREEYPTLLTTFVNVVEFIVQFFRLNIFDILFDNSVGLNLDIDSYPFLSIMQQSVSTASVCRKNSVVDEDEEPLTLENIFVRETNCLTELLCEDGIDVTHEKVIASGLVNPVVLRFLRANPFIKQVPAEKMVQFLEIAYSQILMKWNKKLELYIIKLMKPLFFTVFPRVFTRNTSYASQTLNVPSSYEYMDVVWLSCLQYTHLFIHQLHIVPESNKEFYSNYDKSLTDNSKVLVSPAWQDKKGVTRIPPVFV